MFKKKKEKLLDRTEALRLVKAGEKLHADYNAVLEKRIIKFIDDEIRQAAENTKKERTFCIAEIATAIGLTVTDYYDKLKLSWSAAENVKLYSLVYLTYTRRQFDVKIQYGYIPNAADSGLVISWKPREEVMEDPEDIDRYKVTFIPDYKGYGISNKESGDKNKFLISRFIRREVGPNLYESVNIKSKKGFDYFESVEEAEEYIDTVTSDTQEDKTTKEM